MMYLVLFQLIILNYYHHHIHQCHPMVDFLVLILIDVGRKIDYDDEMKNIVMENRDLMEYDQDLLEMFDNSFLF